MNWLFYIFDSSLPPPSQMPLARGYSVNVWRPSRTAIQPDGLPLYPFGVWWLFHIARVFKNPNYCIVVIHHGGALVHRSCVFPGYFRFPFMAKDDLQVGDTWTHPDHRGNGLAKAGLRACLALGGNDPRRYWYVVEESNTPSIRVVENAGFRVIGNGRRSSPMGLRLFGRFQIDRTSLPNFSKPVVQSDSIAR